MLLRPQTLVGIPVQVEYHRRAVTETKQTQLITNTTQNQYQISTNYNQQHNVISFSL